MCMAPPNAPLRAQGVTFLMILEVLGKSLGSLGKVLGSLRKSLGSLGKSWGSDGGVLGSILVVQIMPESMPNMCISSSVDFVRFGCASGCIAGLLLDVVLKLCA